MATRFRFRLEGLLKLRKSLEEDARRHLALRIAERDEVQRDLERLQSETAQAVEARRTEAGAVLDLERWKAIERFLVVQERRIALRHQDLDQAEQRIQEARQRLTRAHQEHLMLVRLKERRQAQHTLDAEREEAVLLDETSVLRHRFRTHSNLHPQVLP